MNQVSILNHVLGPIMRGPSSSHTAGAYHIGLMARAMLNGEVTSVTVTFDPRGSYATCYHEQGADRAFATALLGRDLTDTRFMFALEDASAAGICVAFRIDTLGENLHPNVVDIAMTSISGQTLRARAQSVGGGAVEFTEVNGWPLRLLGDCHELLAKVYTNAAQSIVDMVTREGWMLSEPIRQSEDEETLLVFRLGAPLKPTALEAMAQRPEVLSVCASQSVYIVQTGQALFTSAAEMVQLADERRVSLAQIALAHECALLGWSERQVLDEVGRRVEIMHKAVREGLSDPPPQTQLVEPTAGAIFRADSEKRLALGGIHTRAACRAMAVMHVNNAMGVVCAAPTAGSAGVIPGVLATLIEELGADSDQAARAFLAAGAVGLVVANRATFAAEVAGCQVEIGAAGAMASAAVVEFAGGSARQACEAAAISFQNTMGSVCDLIQGIVEIPCHTRNAAAASNAFLCADLILGGYVNPVPLDETVDAVYAVGKMLPCELRCTAKGGLAITPSALAMRKRTTI